MSQILKHKHYQIFWLLPPKNPKISEVVITSVFRMVCRWIRITSWRLLRPQLKNKCLISKFLLIHNVFLQDSFYWVTHNQHFCCSIHDLCIVLYNVCLSFSPSGVDTCCRVAPASLPVTSLTIILSNCEIITHGLGDELVKSLNNWSRLYQLRGRERGSWHSGTLQKIH